MNLHQIKGLPPVLRPGATVRVTKNPDILADLNQDGPVYDAYYPLLGQTGPVTGPLPDNDDWWLVRFPGHYNPDEENDLFAFREEELTVLA